MNFKLNQNTKTVLNDRSKIACLFYITLSLLLPLRAKVRGEPWLGSRFAQNCSGCHAPGRMNLPPKDRRCSLSCQGCHVNPNGGGIRSFYGKWNEQRWLRSFTWEHPSQKRFPKPFFDQHYARLPSRFVREKREPSTGSPRDQLNVPYPLVATHKLEVDERFYDRRDGREFKLAESRSQFEEGIPFEDPYREFDHALASTADGTISARHMSFLSQTKNQKQWRSFLMNVDLGMRWRPLYRKLHLVSEFRFLGDPRKTVPDSMIKKPVSRSFYAMVDDLPFNVFVMGGYYLPLFGHYSPDHTHLIQRLISTAYVGQPFAAYRFLFKAMSVGTAPNVPYLNIHRIQDSLSREASSRPVQGWALNAGLRFVTLGASINYSLWHTQQRSLPQATDSFGSAFPTRLLMHSFNTTTTFVFNRWYIGLDLVSIEKDDADSFRRSGIFNIESRLRVWREFYFNTIWTYSRTDEQLLPGYARQIQGGLQAYVIQGLQWSIYVTNEDQQSEGRSPVKRKIISSQWHLYL